MHISKKTLTITIVSLSILAIICGVITYNVYHKKQGVCGETAACAMDPVIDYSNVNRAYSDTSRIYIGYLGPVESEIHDVNSWVFPFTVTQEINGENAQGINVRLGGLHQGGTPLQEGEYVFSLSAPHEKYAQRILRADRVSPEEAEQIHTPADARRIFGDNHALAYAN